jgi:MYXO-CTERM domain-containing protein
MRPSGDVVVELAHPAAAPTNATRTEKFALWVERGTAPADLQSVLLSRIRERESQFRWIVYPASTPTAQPTAVPMLSGGVVLGLLVLAALLLWRRRSVTTRE